MLQKLSECFEFVVVVHLFCDVILLHDTYSELYMGQLEISATNKSHPVESCK